MGVRTLAFSLAAVAVLGAVCAESRVVTFRADDMEIVAPEAGRRDGQGRLTNDAFAAEELRSLLSEAFGADIPVVTAATGRRKTISLEVNPSFARDDIRIVATAKGVRIVSGAARVYGVYEFLERYAGCRFYFPGPLGTIVPKRTELAVPIGTVDVKPCYTQRSNNMNFGRNGEWYSVDGGVASKVEATNLHRQAFWRLRLAPRIPCCHGLNNFHYLERFGKTHPEYFALMKGPDGTLFRDAANSKWTGHRGQLCHTSGIWEKEIYADAVRELSTNEYVDVMAQDGMQRCHCENCQAAYSKDPADPNYATDLMWGKTVALANRLAAEGVKGYVTQMAYTPYRRIPAIDIPSNVLVMVAQTGPWAKADPKRMAKGNAEIRAWARKLGRKVWLWTYPGKFNRNRHPNVPQMTPRAYGEYYAALDDAIFGAFAEGKTDKWIYNYLNYYVKSKVEWNTKLDLDALLDEHHRLMFGAAAGEMKAFYEKLEDIWITKVAGNVAETPLGPVTRAPTEWEMWTRIYAPQVLDEMKAMFDRAAAKLSPGSMEAKRLAFIRCQFYDPLRAESDKFLDKIDATRNEEKRRGREDRSILKGTRFDQPGEIALDGESRKGRSLSASMVGRLKPDTRYVVSYFVKFTNVVATTHNGGIGIELYDGTRSIKHPKAAERVGSKDWIYQEYEIRTSPEIGRNAPPYLRISVQGAKGKAWYRGVRVEEAVEEALSLRRGGFDIVVPENPSKVVEFAARELQTFLGQSLGEAPKISKAPGVGLVHVYLGDSSAARAAGVDVSSLKRDEFVIRASEDSIFIAGRDDPVHDPAKGGGLYERATLFGVYDFLERFAGCRFYFPGELGTVVPRHEEISIGQRSLKVAPAMLIRRPYSYGGDSGPDGAWFDKSIKTSRGKALNLLRLRMGTTHIPCCHGLNDFGYARRFSKIHPEFFALHSNGTRSLDTSKGHGGQLCLSSAIWEEIYQDVKSYLLGEAPEVRGVVGYRGGKPKWGPNCVDGKYVDIMFQDGMFQCQCADCQKAYNRGPEFNGNWATDIVWNNTVAIARRLTAEKVPGYITQMAYWPYNKVPVVDIPTNVLVMVAVTGPWTVRRPDALEAGLRNIREWVDKLGRPVWIWTYPGKYGVQRFPGIPQVTPRAIGKFYKMAAPWVFGTFMESESDRFLYNYFNYYMLSRIAWNADTDVDAVIAEHHRLMFGAAADEMAKFYDALEDRWLDRIMGNLVETELGPQVVPPTNTKLWGEIYSADVVAGLDGLLDRADAKVTPGSLESRRIALFRREFLGGLKAASDRYRKHSDAVKSLVWKPSKGPLSLDRQFGVRKGAEPPPKVNTAVSLENHADSFVFTIRCEEPSIGKMVAKRRVHDDEEIWQDNGVELFLNVSADRVNHYHFFVNSAGSFSDAKCVKAGTRFSANDFKWESGAKVGVTVEPGVWTATLDIPKASMGGIAGKFPVEFLRSRNVEGVPLSFFSWSPYSRLIDELENFGTLDLD